MEPPDAGRAGFGGPPLSVQLSGQVWETLLCAGEVLGEDPHPVLDPVIGARIARERLDQVWQRVLDRLTLPDIVPSSVVQLADLLGRVRACELGLRDWQLDRVAERCERLDTVWQQIARLFDIPPPGAMSWAAPRSLPPAGRCPATPAEIETSGADTLPDRVEPSGRAGPLPSERLTHRERHVVWLMARGLTNVQIGRELAISEGTVKTHVKNILRKLEVPSRAAAVSAWLRQTQAE